MRALRKILFVEDDPDIQTVATMALEVLGGYEVMPCSSGAEAIAQARAVTPDFILLDVMMPDMDGPATLRALRREPGLADVPVAFMTALSRHEDMDKLLALGARGIISKPFDPMTLADRVRELWGDL
ncbi:MAG: response regulator [Cellvibrionaceae bacterium]|nr:response regulator [Cellvibrionaceae bacterium]